MGKTKHKPKKNGKAKKHPLPEVLTLAEAAAWLRVSEEVLHEAAVMGAVPGRMINVEWRFSSDQLRDWLKYPKGNAVNGELREKGMKSNHSSVIRPGFSETEAERQSLLSVIGSMADDESWEPMVEEIYRERARHLVGETP
jgi:hypothetical protein